MLGSLSCNFKQSVYIIIGNDASKVERITANHLKKDITDVSGLSVQILTANDKIPEKGIFYIIGTHSSNPIIKKIVEEQAIALSEEFPGNRGGIWVKETLGSGQEAIILAGSDVQGMQYAVFDYSHKILGIDPFEYWTGNYPTSFTQFTPYDFNNKVLIPPVVPILCYFENDVDELANIKKPLLEYDWENYTQLINSLVRLKYNAIHLFDMLGRPEFFLRPEYKEICPEYTIRLSYIDSMINYAHDMGMMVQVDMALGYKIKPMDQEKADCWSQNKEEWIATWKHYFESTPLAKADIFSLRPRNQVWDWEYKSTCGENKIDVFNEVYAELGKLIDQYKPGAKKVVTCYADGMQMFNDGFNPPKDWIIAWSDNGWGDFDVLPEDTKGYDFGAYMHAGFWTNHTVHDPCPIKLGNTMKMMSNNFKADKYYEINGQQFRPFLLNIEAFSKIAQNPTSFDGEEFYKEWAERYFGEEAAPFAVDAMKKLHEAQFDDIGYVQHLWEIREAISYLCDEPIERPGKEPVDCEFSRVSNDFEHVKKRIGILKQALANAEKGAKYINEENTFYHDYIVLPINLYLDLLHFERKLHRMVKLKKVYDDFGKREKLQKALLLLDEAKNELDNLVQRRLDGDKNPRWEGWYDPAIRRPNNGFPTMELLNKVETNLKGKL